MPDGLVIPGGPGFAGSPQPPDVPCDPTGDAWRGPPGPAGPPGPPGGLQEAPVDGTAYGRLSAAWVQVLPLTGGTLTGPLTLAGGPLKVSLPSDVWSAGTVTPAFWSQVGLTGTTNAATPNINVISINESLDASGASASPAGLTLLHNYGGGTTKGGRAAFNATLVQQGGANTDSGADRYYVGANLYAFARYTQPGSSATTPLGRVFGFNAVGTLQAGFTATNYYQVAGGEINFGVAAGSSTSIRSGLTIADLTGTAQGFNGDNALWFYGAGTPLRNSIMWADSQPWPVDATVGRMLTANMGASFTAGAADPLKAMWGIDFQQVQFPATGNPYGGGFFQTNGASLDGVGTLRLGTTYLTPGATGLAIDAKGSVGLSATISTPGSGYAPSSTNAFTALGGVFLVTMNGSGVPSSVIVVVQPQWPSTSAPPATVTPTDCVKPSTGSGLVLAITWNTTGTALSLQPSGGALGFYGATPVAKQIGVPITAAGIHAALTALGLIAP